MAVHIYIYISFHFMYTTVRTALSETVSRPRERIQIVILPLTAIQEYLWRTSSHPICSCLTAVTYTIAFYQSFHCHNNNNNNVHINRNIHSYNKNYAWWDRRGLRRAFESIRTRRNTPSMNDDFGQRVYEHTRWFYLHWEPSKTSSCWCPCRPSSVLLLPLSREGKNYNVYEYTLTIYKHQYRWAGVDWSIEI